MDTRRLCVLEGDADSSGKVRVDAALERHNPLPVVPAVKTDIPAWVMQGEVLPDVILGGMLLDEDRHVRQGLLDRGVQPTLVHPYESVPVFACQVPDCRLELLLVHRRMVKWEGRKKCCQTIPRGHAWDNRHLIIGEGSSVPSIDAPCNTFEDHVNPITLTEEPKDLLRPNCRTTRRSEGGERGNKKNPRAFRACNAAVVSWNQDRRNPCFS